MAHFKFSAWADFQDQYVAHPGKTYDMTNNEGASYVPVGGPAPYGRVLVRGPESHPATVGPTGARPFPEPAVPLMHRDRYFTKVDSACLPDKAGLYLKHDDGRTYAAAGVTLPVDDNGLLIPVGIGEWTEACNPANTALATPFGFRDFFYQECNDGQIGVATQGRIWVYCETEMQVGDNVYFRTAGASLALPTNTVDLLGAISNVGGADKQQLAKATVFRPGPVGGACVLQLNGF